MAATLVRESMRGEIKICRNDSTCFSIQTATSVAAAPGEKTLRGGATESELGMGGSKRERKRRELGRGF